MKNIIFSRLKDGEKSYTICQSFYEQNNSISQNGSQYFMNSNTLEFIDEVSKIHYYYIFKKLIWH